MATRAAAQVKGFHRQVVMEGLVGLIEPPVVLLMFLSASTVAILLLLVRLVAAPRPLPLLALRRGRWSS
jgi:hypothetical protein